MVLAEVVVEEGGPEAEAENHEYDGELEIVGEHEGELVGIGQVPELPGVEDKPKDVKGSAEGQKD